MSLWLDKVNFSIWSWTMVLLHVCKVLKVVRVVKKINKLSGAITALRWHRLLLIWIVSKIDPNQFVVVSISSSCLEKQCWYCISISNICLFSISDLPSLTLSYKSLRCNGNFVSTYSAGVSSTGGEYINSAMFICSCFPFRLHLQFQGWFQWVCIPLPQLYWHLAW